MRKTSKPAGATATPEGDARQRILEGARRHFFSLGFRGVTMSDLAAELGMSKKTLYAHFASKTELLQAVLQDKFTHVEQDLEQATATSACGFTQQLHDLLAVLQTHTGEIQPAFVRDVRRESPELFEMIRARRGQMIQRFFGKVLRMGRKTDTIRKDIPVELMIEILLGATESVVNPAKMSELGLTPKEGFLTIIAIFLEGVIQRKDQG